MKLLYRNNCTHLIVIVLTVMVFSFIVFSFLESTTVIMHLLIKRLIAPSDSKLVCYYVTPNSNDTKELSLSQVDAYLCTHINVGVANIENSTIVLSERLKEILQIEVPLLRARNSALKILLWVGEAGTGRSFSQMVANHDRRKIFIKSLRDILLSYELDGVDLDWEFPSAYYNERTHFSQLMYEIRQEFKREKRDYLLSVAVAAVEGIASFAYDIRELNLYADHVNLMTYDYHFYSRGTPFTGLNAPLYARENERSILATLNINSSVVWWLRNGIAREKLVVGLPTFGHSFTLVNPFNNGIYAPAKNIGKCGELGFTTYSDVCWLMSQNAGSKKSYDHRAASPYVSYIDEWISYENETSIAAKTNYIRSLGLGGIMVFSLNTDDIHGYCGSHGLSYRATFPLVNTIKQLVFEDL